MTEIVVGEFREGMPLSELIQLAVNDARKAVDTGKRATITHLTDGIFVSLGERRLEAWEYRSFTCLAYVEYGKVFHTWPDVDATPKQEQAAYEAGCLIRAHHKPPEIAPLETYEAAAKMLAEVGL